MYFAICEMAFARHANSDIIRVADAAISLALGVNPRYSHPHGPTGGVSKISRGDTASVSPLSITLRKLDS